MSFLQRVILNKQTICKLLCTVSLVAFLVSVATQVFVSNTSVIKSSELIKLSAKRAQLEEEITWYKNNLAAISCLSHIEKAARAQGFVDMEGSLLVVKPAPVAAAIRQ